MHRVAWVALALAACATGKDAESNCQQPPSQGLSQPCCAAQGIDACGAMLFCAAFDGRTTATCYAEYSRQNGEQCGENRHCMSRYCDLATRKCAVSTSTGSAGGSAGSGGSGGKGGGGGGGASTGCGSPPKTCDQACQVAWCCGKNGLCPEFKNEATSVGGCVSTCNQLGSGFIDFVDPNNCTQTISSLNSVSSAFKKSCSGG